MSTKLATCFNITDGPLRMQNTVTLYEKKLLAVWQTTQRGKKNSDYLVQKANILSFQGPTALLAIQQGVYCTM